MFLEPNHRDIQECLAVMELLLLIAQKQAGVASFLLGSMAWLLLAVLLMCFMH